MIYLGADHRGFALKEKIKLWLKEWGYKFEDCGNTVYDKEDDYVEFVFAVANKIAKNLPSPAFAKASAGNTGIVICGSGIGVSIAANRIAGIRCALGFSKDQVKHGRHNDNINMLALASEYSDEGLVKEMIRTFLTTDFDPQEGYLRRIGKVN